MPVNITQYGMAQRNLLNLLFPKPRSKFRPSYPHIQWKTRDLYLEVYKLESEVNHAPASSTKVKKAWRYVSTPSMRSWRSQGQVCLAIKEYESLLHVKYNYSVSLPISIYSM